MIFEIGFFCLSEFNKTHFILKALLTIRVKEAVMRAMKNGNTSRPDGNPVEIYIKWVAKFLLSVSASC